MTLDAAIIDRIYGPEILEISAAFTRYVQAQAVRVLEELGIRAAASAPCCRRALIDALRIAPHARTAFWWLMREAVHVGYLRRWPDGSYQLATAAPEARETAAAMRVLDAHGPIVAISRQMIDYVAGAYVSYLQGTRSPASILLRHQGLTLWHRYFSSSNPLYDLCNQLAAAGLQHVWPALSRPPRILELGAGTGGTTSALLDTLSELPGGGDAEFVMSDVAPSFLVQATARFAGRGRRVRAQRLDFERPFEDQGVVPGAFDVIVATNALHVCRDLAVSLDFVRRAMAPAGVLIVSEAVCPTEASVYQEFVFNLMRDDDGRSPDDDGIPSHFLCSRQWRQLLEHGRFQAALAVNRYGSERVMLALASRASQAALV